MGSRMCKQSRNNQSCSHYFKFTGQMLSKYKSPTATPSCTRQLFVAKYVGISHLINTLRPRQMDAISQTTFSKAFSWIKMFEFRLKFHWSLFPRVQLTIFQQWFRLWLGAVQATSHYLNQWWLVYRRIYASLGLIELSFNNVEHPKLFLNIPEYSQLF